MEQWKCTFSICYVHQLQKQNVSQDLRVLAGLDKGAREREALLLRAKHSIFAQLHSPVHCFQPRFGPLSTLKSFHQCWSGSHASKLAGNSGNQVLSDTPSRFGWKWVIFNITQVRKLSVMSSDSPNVYHFWLVLAKDTLSSVRWRYVGGIQRWPVLCCNSSQPICTRISYDTHLLRHTEHSFKQIEHQQ